MNPEVVEDRVKARLLQVTVSCLEHARTVRFGMATAAYETSDSDLRLTVTVQISSTLKTEKAT